jgi:hypothetical protein
LLVVKIYSIWHFSACRIEIVRTKVFNFHLLSRGETQIQL